MYEDDRKILPTGLLGTASQKTYTPQPIVLKEPNKPKPTPGHINKDKEQERQKQLQEQQASQQGGGKIICTEYYLMGYLSERVYLADQIFGNRVAMDEPEFMCWYHRRAPWWIKHMRKSWLFTQVLWWFVKPWSEQMAFEMDYRQKGNWFGKFLMKAGYWMYKHGY